MLSLFFYFESWSLQYLVLLGNVVAQIADRILVFSLLLNHCVHCLLVGILLQGRRRSCR